MELREISFPSSFPDRRVVRFDARLHAEGVLDLLTRMRGQPYPGPLGGNSRNDLLHWLEDAPMLQRWVALSPNGAVCGHVGVSLYTRSDWVSDPEEGLLELTRLFVAPEVRRSGVARELMARVTDFGESLGVGLVLAVSDYLSEAVALYRSGGWRQVSETVSFKSGDRLLIFRF